MVKANKALNQIADIIKLKRLNKKQAHVLESKNTTAVAKIEKPKAELEAPKFKRLAHPVSIEGALNRLRLARESIIKHGYRAKYSDDELLAMAKAGDVANERFHVRFMAQRNLKYDSLGAPMEGDSLTGSKYWSTTFDQIEDADSDPKLISEKLGLDYDPKSDYALVIIDTEKSKNVVDMYSEIPTFENMNVLTKMELSKKFTPAQVDTLLTSEFQANYATHINDAIDSKIMKNEWDARGAKNYFSDAFYNDSELRNLMKKRFEMQNALGNNQHFTGNGLTKSLLPDDKAFGAVEILNIERTPTGLADFGDSIKIIKDLSSVITGN